MRLIRPSAYTSPPTMGLFTCKPENTSGYRPLRTQTAQALFMNHVRNTIWLRIIKRPSHGKLKLVNSCWQTQVGVCERHKNSRQTRFYLTPTVCKRVCRLFLCRSHTPTWVCQHEFANLSLPCKDRLRVCVGFLQDIHDGR